MSFVAYRRLLTKLRPLIIGRKAHISFKGTGLNDIESTVNLKCDNDTEIIDECRLCSEVSASGPQTGATPTQTERTTFQCHDPSLNCTDCGGDKDDSKDKFQPQTEGIGISSVVTFRNKIKTQSVCHVPVSASRLSQNNVTFYRGTLQQSLSIFTARSLGSDVDAGIIQFGNWCNFSSIKPERQTAAVKFISNIDSFAGDVCRLLCKCRVYSLSCSSGTIFFTPGPKHRPQR